VALTLGAASIWLVSHTSYLAKLMLTSASNIVAPSDKTITMTVNGASTEIVAETYTGTIDLEVQ